MRTAEIMQHVQTIDIVEVVEMVAAGHSYREVGERFGVSYHWVSQRMRELEVQGGKPWKRSRRIYNEEKAKERWRAAFPW